MNKILPLINHGHKHFGENKVQEAIDKWTSVKEDFIDIKLHLIGKLQTNKVKFAVNIFDYIHSVDNEKLANKISSEIKKNKKKIKIFNFNTFFNLLICNFFSEFLAIQGMYIIK